MWCMHAGGSFIFSTAFWFLPVLLILFLVLILLLMDCTVCSRASFKCQVSQHKQRPAARDVHVNRRWQCLPDPCGSHVALYETSWNVEAGSFFL